MNTLKKTFLKSALLLGAAGNLVAQAPKETALDAYIKKPDSNFKFEVLKKSEGDGYTYFVLKIISQKWRTKKEVDRTLWEHHLRLIVPTDVRTDIGLVAISGGSNSGAPVSDKPPSTYGQFAVLTGSVIGEFRMVPNQPLVYAGEEKRRSEDASIAYTWDKFLRGGDSEWPLQLPMVKSAVRAMDAMTQFCATEEGGGHKVERFCVAGASKRGWTTWLTAAVDKRVIAIAPVVIDVLNTQKSFEHHHSAYGFFAPAVDDYVEMGIMDWAGTKEYEALYKMVDPFAYRERLKIPKFIMNSTGDQFFLPDSWQFYWKDLVGEKHLRYVPNTDHGLGGSDAYESLLAFYDSIVNDRPRPEYTWSVQEDGSIKVVTKTEPLSVKVWQAASPDKRDFRKETIGKAWQESPLEPESPNTYVARIAAPKKGYVAYMVEMTYKTGGLGHLRLTTGVKVLPETLPHKPYTPKKKP